MPMDNNGIVLIDDNLLDYKLKTKRLNLKKLFHCFINLIQMAHLKTVSFEAICCKCLFVIQVDQTTS